MPLETKTRQASGPTNTTMWVADYSDYKIYAYNLSTKARDSGKDFNTLEDAENEGPEGIWSDGYDDVGGGLLGR